MGDCDTGESESDMDDGGTELVDICLKAEQVPPSLAKVHTQCVGRY